MTNSRIFLCFIAACGGSSPGPQPLKNRFDETNIALVPLSETTAVQQAQQDYFRSRLAQQTVERQYQDIKTEINVATNAQKKAILDEESASSRAQAAESSNDMNRINAASRESHAAKLNPT